MWQAANKGINTTARTELDNDTSTTLKYHSSLIKSHNSYYKGLFTNYVSQKWGGGGPHPPSSLVFQAGTAKIVSLS